MNIVLEKLNDLGDKPQITINSKDELINYLSDSYNLVKCIKGFDIFLNESATLKDNEYLLKEGHKFFLDHKNYCNLFLSFVSEEQIINYVQDTCEARGETIPKNYKGVVNWLNNDKTILYEIIEFKLCKNQWNEIKEMILTKK